jgi:predicted transcriptional regulator
MSEATKTTVYLDADDYRRLKALARAQGGSAAELVREAVAEYVRHRAPVNAPASIGVGHSGRGDVSTRSEELLGDDFGR